MYLPLETTEIENTERYLNPREFAKKYGWAYKKTLKLAKTKGFPSFKPLDDSNRYLIDVAGIPGWLDMQKKKPKPKTDR